MKKVGLLIHGMGVGGAERVVSRLTSILSDKCELRLIVFDDSLKEYEVSCPVISMNIPAAANFAARMLLPFKRAKALKRIKREEGFDWVISFLDSPNIVNLLSKTKGCKSAVSIRNYSETENRGSVTGKIFDFFSRNVYKHGDCVIPVTKVIAESFVKRYNIPEKKISVIYNPYDVLNLQQQAEEELSGDESAFFREKLVISSVGRFSHQKGFWHLIKAFALAKKQIPELGLCIIGSGESMEQAEKLVSDLGINDSVLLTGRQANPFKYVAKSKLYVLSSLFEGFPNALAEAMACGCPVVAADCKSGPREILFKSPDLNAVCKAFTEADYGFLVPPLENEEDWNSDRYSMGDKTLAEALTTCLSAGKRLREYSEKALLRAGEFSYTKCSEAYMNIINN